MIRTLLLCGVLSVGSAWGQQTISGYDGTAEGCARIGGVPDATGCNIPIPIPYGQYNLVQSPLPRSEARTLSPVEQAQLDRIERMLRAICAHRFYASGQPDCPRDAP